MNTTNPTPPPPTTTKLINTSTTTSNAIGLISPNDDDHLVPEMDDHDELSEFPEFDEKFLEVNYIDDLIEGLPEFGNEAAVHVDEDYTTSSTHHHPSFDDDQLAGGTNFDDEMPSFISMDIWEDKKELDLMEMINQSTA